MSYTILTRVYQTNTNAWFTNVERTVWHYANGGTWHDDRGEHILRMGGSGTSGSLRFQAEGGENYVLVLGVHNYKPWVDIRHLKQNETSLQIHPHYYGESSEYTRAREAQKTSWEIVGADGRKISAKYFVSDGKDLKLNLVIG